jgi:hypothetical protein
MHGWFRLCFESFPWNGDAVAVFGAPQLTASHVHCHEYYLHCPSATVSRPLGSDQIIKAYQATTRNWFLSFCNL